MSWIELVRLNVKAAAALSKDGVRGMRKAMLAIWLAIDGAEENVRDMFRGFDEDGLEAEVAGVSLVQALSKVPTTAPKNRATKEALLRALAVCLRRLERELRGLAGGRVQRREKPMIVEFDGFSAYLVMQAPRHRVAKTGDRFRRRGLKSMRLIPRKIGKIAVRLKPVQDFRGRARVEDKIPVSIAAALFPGLRFLEDEVEEGFVILDVEFEDQIGVVRKQIADASISRCAGLVYPELCISPRTLSAVMTGLSDGDWNECELSMIVAGSQHVTDDQGRRFNVCKILDGYGNEIGEHKKLFRYSDGGGPHEAIEFGTELQVLVMEEGLFAFGICLDFCIMSERPPYLDLDVDYVLIPSCGNETTMNSHVDRSSELMTNFKARTVVVQQQYPVKPDGTSPLGYVLARLDTVRPTVDSLATNDPWHIRVI